MIHSLMSWDRPYWIDYTKSKTPQDADSCVSVLFTWGIFSLEVIGGFLLLYAYINVQNVFISCDVILNVVTKVATYQGVYY